MTTLRHAALACAGAALLAGCSDGDGGPGEGSPFNERAGRLLLLEAASNEIDDTDPSVSPPPGSATYDGVISIEAAGAFNGSDALMGDITLVADFDGDDVTGSAGGFVSPTGERFAGAIPITNGDIFDGGTFIQYSGTMDGTLSDRAGDPHVLDTSLDGSFDGSSYEFVNGDLSGTVTSGGVVRDMDGDIYGRRRP